MSFSGSDLRNDCRLIVDHALNQGTRTSGVYVMPNNLILKVYNGRLLPFGYNIETDITCRLLHPGLVKCVDIIIRSQCNSLNLNHALILEYVKCERSSNPLRSLMVDICARLLLQQNNYMHRDFAEGNQCETVDGYRFIDFNRDLFINYPTLKRHRFLYYGLDRPLLELSPLQQTLHSDFVNRIKSKDPNVVMSCQEMVSHPLFKVSGIEPIYGTTKPRHVDRGNWCARNFDVLAPWYIILQSEDMDEDLQYIGVNVAIMEAMDVYYRYLPFVIAEDELYNLAAACIYLIIDINPNIQTWIFNLPDIDVSIMDNIIKNLGGQIRDRHFYHEARNIKDISICWSLMKLPYDEYMKINSNRFYELVTPMLKSDKNPVISVEDIINMSPNYELGLKMQELTTENNIIFDKLTIPEAIEFLDLYNIYYEYDNARFYLTDAARRLYIFLISNSPNATVTWPVKDLLESNKDIFTLLHLRDNTNEIDVAQALNLEITSNINERISRIFRMNYLDFKIKGT